MDRLTAALWVQLAVMSALRVAGVEVSLAAWLGHLAVAGVVALTGRYAGRVLVAGGFVPFVADDPRWLLAMGLALVPLRRADPVGLAVAGAVVGVSTRLFHALAWEGTR